MPQIKDYSAQISPLAGEPGGRQATASDFGGTGVGELGAGLEKTGAILHDVAQTQEVSDVRAKMAKVRADWTVHLQETATKGGDFANKFIADFGDTVGQFGDGISTRGGRLAFEQQKAELTSHFVQAAGLEQARQAGVKAKQDYLSALDQSRNTVWNDPTQFDGVLRDLQNSISDPNGPYAKMSSEDKEKLARQTRGEVALSAAQGMIRANPEMGEQILKSGRWDQYLDADKKNSLESFATVQLNAKRIEQMRLDAAAEKAERKASEAAENRVISDLFSDQPKMTAQEIANNPALKPAAKLTMLNVLARTTKPDPLSRISQETTTSILTDIRRDPDDPLKITDNKPIYDAFIRGDLTRADFEFLNKEQANDRSPDGSRFNQEKGLFLKSLKGSIDKSVLGNLDDTGGTRYYNFERFVDDKVQEYKAAKKDPRDLFNPKKPDYLGDPQVVTPFQSTVESSIAAVNRRLTGQQPGAAAPPAKPGLLDRASKWFTGPASADVPSASVEIPLETTKIEPRKAGESAADYLKRAK